MKIKDSSLTYKYYDNYNVIDDLLKLLFAFEFAGNNTHNIEIILIIEKLREAHIKK